MASWPSMDALLWSLGRRPGAGREHALGLPRGVDPGGRLRPAVRAAQPGDQGCRPSADVGTDRRCRPGGRTPAAAHRRREGRDQGRQVGGRDLAGEAREGGTEGHRCVASRAFWPCPFQGADEWPPGHSWTVETAKGKVEGDGTIKRDVAIPEFGYKSHITIDQRHGFIRRQQVTDAAAHDGARRRDGLIDPSIPPRLTGPTPPTGRRRMRITWPIAASAAGFTDASRPASRCRSAPPEPTPGSPRCGRRSSPSSPGKSSG